ncbi:MAG: tRNA (adenosine(37)-N6)-threonylcarbamoyltransferase complex ATPase subunit type 1 TsaE [Parcubacteria group bacterium]|jgi:tRNA threonylcarbamoyladenosine biosynthesis protein TsaE
MGKEFITENFKETQKLGELLASELRGGEIICLSGDLGAGKTTFTQGLLKGLKVKGPYTSPTFLVMKHYRVTHNVERVSQKLKMIHDPRSTLHAIYHIDAYRVNAKDILNLGWEEIVADKNNVIIVEWAEKIRKIIPKSALWLQLQWIDENKRKIIIKKLSS